MNIFMVINTQKDPEYSLAKRVAAYIHNRANLFTNADSANLIPSVGVKQQSNLTEIDVILVLGGDGTILSVASDAAKQNIPVVGINLGRLGFLAEIEVTGIEQALDKLLLRDYVIEERTMLRVSLANNEEAIALNDIVISRGNAALKILETDVSIDDEYVDDFKADGMIIATPTGSTAYSLSAGGPIVDPTMDSMILTPICPHKMYSRTIIVPPQKTITVTNKTTNENDAFVAADSRVLGKISENESVLVSTAKQRLKLVRLFGQRFFGDLHNKLVKKES